MNSSDNFLKAAINGRATIPYFPELVDPEDLVVLAASHLNALHPNADRMAVLVACRDALRRLINKVIEDREGKFREHLGSRYGIVLDANGT